MVRHEPVVTFGCRLNAYESEVIRRHVDAVGLADAIVINTCAVTSEAVRQAAQTIRRKRREHPAARIVVTGCAVHTDAERFTDMPEVDYVIGNSEKLTANAFNAIATGTSERIRVDDIMSVRDTANHLIDGFGTRARAYVQVQNGCDHRCTFCVIPFGRGPSRSVPAGEVVAQVRRLVEAGHAEVVLTGVDMTSYGGDLPGSPSLGWLIRQILRHVPELARLRLSSIDQVEADDHLLRAIAEEPRLMPHLHLSMQAGHDMILKRMKRRHLREDAIRFCREVRRLRPDIAFGADLIAGFPTESDDMFRATLDIAEECDLTFLHVFPFSPRPGTPAAKMPQLPRPLVKERAARLRDEGARRLAHFLDKQVGQVVDALVERHDIGRTPQFAEARLAEVGSVGQVAKVRVTGHDGRRLLTETFV